MARNDTAPITKADLKAGIRQGLLEFWDEVLEPAFSKIYKRFGEVEKRFGGIEKRLDHLETGQRDIKRQLNDLKVDTPTRRESDELKARVDRHHPIP